MNRIKPHMNKATSQFLDLSRWVSAALVVITHLNNRMFTNLSEIPHDQRSFIHFAWGFLSGFGSQAVTVFFVLSGYLVGGRVLEQILDEKKVSLRKYAVDRITRIYVVLLPTIAVIGILDLIGSRLIDNDNLYSHYELSKHLTFGTLLGTLLNLQGIFTDFFGTNGPLATLATEFWYYVIFPLLVSPWLPGRGKRARSILTFTGIIILTLWTFKNPWFGLGFVYWCIGAFGRVARNSFFPLQTTMAVLMFLGFLFLTRISLRSSFLGTTEIQFIYGVIVSILFLNVIRAIERSGFQSMPLGSFNHFMADFSYSLYALHASLLTFLCILLESTSGFGWKEIASQPIHWIAASIVLFMTYAICYLFASLTEKRTSTVRSIAYHSARIRQEPR
jgi:peptidoglycan/LPS O-acetylase OafA/YrhL